MPTWKRKKPSIQTINFYFFHVYCLFSGVECTTHRCFKPELNNVPGTQMGPLVLNGKGGPSFERFKPQKKRTNRFQVCIYVVSKSVRPCSKSVCFRRLWPRPEAVSEKGSPRSAVDPDVALAAMDSSGWWDMIGSMGRNEWYIYPQWMVDFLLVNVDR